MPNTFPRVYLNFKPISLIVRSKILPRRDAIYIVPRPLQKLGGNSQTPCVHSGDSIGGYEFNSFVSCSLTLIKAFSILVCMHIHLFFCPLTSVGDEWEGGRLYSSPNLLKFIPLTHNRCHHL